MSKYFTRVWRYTFEQGSDDRSSILIEKPEKVVPVAHQLISPVSSTYDDPPERSGQQKRRSRCPSGVDNGTAGAGGGERNHYHRSRGASNSRGSAGHGAPRIDRLAATRSEIHRIILQMRFLQIYLSIESRTSDLAVHLFLIFCYKYLEW